MTENIPSLDCTDENLTEGKRKLIAWLQLMRIPNLFTVPGDPLVGYLLVQQGGTADIPAIVSVVGVSLLLYVGGLILNDVMDVYVDCVEAPQRPLPSRTILRSHAIAVMLFVFALGLFLSATIGIRAFLAAGTLWLFILAYNLGGKKRPIIGEILMGACRGASVMVGAMAADGDPLRGGLAAVTVALYVAAVTALARKEREPTAATRLYWPPAVVLVVAAMASFFIYSFLHMRGAQNGFVLLAMAAAMAFLTGRKMFKQTLPAPSAIGTLLRVLIVVQVAFLLMAPKSVTTALFSVLLGIFAVAHFKLCKLFYAS